ncbi:hypothetical protein [Nitrolancea hollandica]|uniref:Uncharacterized protein n=1 Tax=Nitrolancea hollandica Lb TaxID=1129897 RepID=I4EFH0_9BACT|nr:hypothetical protein [Nitrolancea hollandica]CCF83432.1 membrane hypothetical protein [Nitrolancea hollandica Lb]
MNTVLRFLGVLVTVFAGIVASDPSNLDFTARDAVETVVLRFVVGVVGGLLIRSWWATAIVPIVFIVTYWIAREYTCPGCAGPTYDVGILGAIIYDFIGLIPMMLGTAPGAVTGRSLEKGLERPSAD